MWSRVYQQNLWLHNPSTHTPNVFVNLGSPFLANKAHPCHHFPPSNLGWVKAQLAGFAGPKGLQRVAPGMCGLFSCSAAEAVSNTNLPLCPLFHFVKWCHMYGPLVVWTPSTNDQVSTRTNLQLIHYPSVHHNCLLT